MSGTLAYNTDIEELDAQIDQAHKRRLERQMSENKEKPGISTGVAVLIGIIAVAVIGALGFFIVKTVPSSLFEKHTAKVGFETTSAQMDSSLTSKKEAVSGPLEGRQVYYAGLEDCVVNSESVVYLENLKENDDIYMSYVISTGGEVIYETGLIPSGEYSKWVPSEVLSAGEYELSIKNIPYYDHGDGNYEQLAYQPVNVINMTVVK